MKVLLINSVSGFGSTGRICNEIGEFLINQGHQCVVAYGQLNSNFKYTFKIGTKIENHLHNLFSRIFGNQGYYSFNGTEHLIKFIKEFQPDIIHLHNIHGNYINFPLLFTFLNNFEKPIFWTFHDCWPFTGKCAHFSDANCMKWQVECNHCPQLKTYPPSIFFDKSHTNYLDKKKYFTTNSNLTILTVSNWLKSQVEKSYFHKNKIVNLYNWIDLDVFKFQKELNSISKNILFVSTYWQKNDVKWQDLNRLLLLLDETYEITVVGKLQNGLILPKNVMHIKEHIGPSELSVLYNKAQVYVHLATEDTFGKVIAESFACGTPVIAYDSTVYPELINAERGRIVEKRNVNLVKSAIDEILILGKNQFSENCIRYVMNNCNKELILNDLMQLYKQKTLK